MNNEPIFMRLSRGFEESDTRENELRMQFGARTINQADAKGNSSMEKMSDAYNSLHESERNLKEYKAMYEELKTEALQKKAEMEEAKRIEGIRKKVLDDLSKLPEFQKIEE